MPHLDTTNVHFIALLWMALALAASLLSIRLGVSVALCEIGVGVIAGVFVRDRVRPPRGGSHT